MLRIDTLPDWFRGEIMSAITPIAQLDRALREMGANPTRPPSFRGGSRIEQLGWGVDSVVATARLLLCGQIAGAAVLARNQIEVWTAARAAFTGAVRIEGEADSEFIARTWSLPVAPSNRRRASVSLVFDWAGQYALAADAEREHQHVRLRSGRELCPAALWMALSELLHGRALAGASIWDASCLDTDMMGDADSATLLVLDALRLSVFHLRNELRVASHDLGLKRATDALRFPSDEFSIRDEREEPEVTGRNQLPQPTDLVAPPMSYMAPLLPEEGLSKAVIAQLAEASEAFEEAMNGRRPAGRPYRDDELITAAFGWHRLRSAVTAQRALDREKLYLLDRYDPDGLAHRGTTWVVVTEAAALLALWLAEGPPRDAASLMASSLRSSWWLWLEDDDRAMAALRPALEQAARARVWRQKPGKAAKLEVRSTPRDWLNAAGWSRLGPLNFALGEFSHSGSDSDHEGARALLTAIQDAPDPIEAPFTARRAAIELVTSLIGVEICNYLQDPAPRLANALRELFLEVGLLPEDEAVFIESKLAIVAKYRNVRTRAETSGSGSSDQSRPK